MRVYNTLTKKKEEFKPIVSGKVGLYCCGPTVYHYAHIGNLRAYIFNDILRRVLERKGLIVEHVMNITDVGHLTSDSDEGEDKMAKGAEREGKTVWEIAKFYEEEFFKDTKSLNILKPTVVCKATDHIKDMITLIVYIEKNGYTYESGGNIYFDTSKFDNYYELAGHKPDESEMRARVDEDSAKKNKADFVLWFTRSKFGNQDMQWDSPWGRGFPGWHLECSAMSMKYLGEQFDIHCGGVDHIPIHHTNEIAQAEGATGKRPWVKYWMHNEFLVMDKGKMSKSSGDFLRMQSILDKGYDPLAYRYFCLGAHYRQQLMFSWEGLDGAANTLKRLREKMMMLKEETPEWNDITDKDHEYQQQFSKALEDDLNTAGALAVMWSVLRDEELGSQEQLELLMDFDNVFGLGFADWEREKIKVSDEVQGILDERAKARAEKDWVKSDEFRDLLKSKGFVVKDGPDGQKLERYSGE